MVSLIAVTSSSARMDAFQLPVLVFVFRPSFLGGGIYFGTYFRADEYLYRSAFPEYPIFAFLALQELGEVALRQHGGAAELFEGQPHCSLYFCLYLILFVGAVRRFSCFPVSSAHLARLLKSCGVPVPRTISGRCRAFSFEPVNSSSSMLHWCYMAHQLPAVVDGNIFLFGRESLVQVFVFSFGAWSMRAFRCRVPGRYASSNT